MKNYFRTITFVMLCIGTGFFGTLQATNTLEAVEIIKQDKSLVATYVEYSEEEGYKFSTKDGDIVIFHHVSEEVSEAIDLKSGDYKGKTFEIAYTVSEAEGQTKYVITGLKEVS
ncbi:hypothetical protein [Tenacibaculum agarivorans]|uniref:hypothetical protein n=1 Tax=Tenacibaculum agarivorans TaxID=1908389 RepID=UPI000AFCC045|nr:hypothetical protein [Tenacibaculum agarivorans]